MKLVKLKQNTKPWLDWRRKMIMASDAPVIMRMSPYKTPERLLEEKIKGFEVVPNPYMLRGKELEPIALERFEEETGHIMFPMIAQHDKFEWMGASFDGVTIDRDNICEIKCPGKKDHKLALEGTIPHKYIAQVQHQIYVSGLDFSYYYSFDGNEGKILRVDRDEKFIENMLEKEFEFWELLACALKVNNLNI